jgi:hypothetical protein
VMSQDIGMAADLLQVRGFSRLGAPASPSRVDRLMGGRSICRLTSSVFGRGPFSLARRLDVAQDHIHRAICCTHVWQTAAEETARQVTSCYTLVQDHSSSA